MDFVFSTAKRSWIYTNASLQYVTTCAYSICDLGHTYNDVELAAFTYWNFCENVTASEAVVIQDWDDWLMPWNWTVPPRDNGPSVLVYCSYTGTARNKLQLGILFHDDISVSIIEVIAELLIENIAENLLAVALLTAYILTGPKQKHSWTSECAQNFLIIIYRLGLFLVAILMLWTAYALPNFPALTAYLASGLRYWRLQSAKLMNIYIGLREACSDFFSANGRIARVCQMRELS